VVEKAVIISGVLYGKDGLVDEAAEASEVAEQGFRKVEVHDCKYEVSTAVFVGWGWLEQF
jgi:hypothetical protein